MTVADLITDALNVCGQLNRGQTPSPDDLQYGFNQLNAILDSWSTERLNLYSVQRSQYTLTPGQQDYTVGPSGNFVQNRPVLIQAAAIVITTS